MLKNTIKEIPGFRTGSKWKMVFATIMYFFAIIIMINISGATLRDKLIGILEFLIILGVPFVLVTNIGNIRNKLPIFNRRSIKFNILGSLIVFIIMGIGVSTADSFKSPEQKQLDSITAQQSEAKKVAKDLDSKIAALGDVNSLTLDKASDVKAIRTRYDALTSEQKGLVTKFAVLVSAEKKIVELQATADKRVEEKAVAKKVAADLDSKITALGEVNSLTLDKASDVKATRTGYEALTSEQKGLVTKLAVLVSAEKKITDLQAVADKGAEEKVPEKVAQEASNQEKATNNTNNYSSENSSSSSGGTTTNEPAQGNRTVYWTSGGKSYHYDRNCRTLARSKNVLEGPASSCPKTDPCDICAK